MRRLLVLALCVGAVARGHRHLLSRRSCGASALGVLLPAFAASPPGETYTFDERSLGLELAPDGAGRVQIARVRPDSPVIAKGVPPLATVVEVNGVSTDGLSAEQVQALVRSSARPLTLRLDASRFRALPPTEQTEAAAAALGMDTDRVRIELLTGPQDPRCAYRTRESDVVEVEYAGSIAATGRVFDSSEMRSGRPFAFLLGNGDVVKGLELGTMEMCIGEERRVSVPPLLGFGRKGSKAYGVPPDAALEYRIRLVSINMQTDPKARRVDIDDEQRFSEDGAGNVVNDAESER